MTDPLSALIIEASALEAEVVVRELARAGFVVEHEVVDNADALRDALERREWQVVVADFNLPSFSASEALEISSLLAPEVPFVVVSGVIGDEGAIDLMRRGAKDYVFKENLARLGAAVRREVDEARERAQHRVALSALRRSEQIRELLSTALNSAAVPVVICDNRGMIEWANAAFSIYSGYSTSESRGRNLRKLIDSGQNDPGLRATQIEALRKGISWSGEMLNRRKDGTVHPDHVTLTPVRNTAGRVSHFVAILHDLTEQRSQEERLLQSRRLESVGQLAGGIAHDFNNLLTVIIGNAELLTEHLSDHPKLGSFAGMISDAAERGADLTRALLAFARQQTLSPKSVDINRLALGMQPLLSRTLGEHIDLEFQLDDAAGNILVDPSELQNALLNLSLNARDAMPGGGCLTFATGQRFLGSEHADRDPEFVAGQYAMIEVSDTGTGILPEHIERLFEPFFTTKKHGKGTGLGLPRVHGFVKQSGGHIMVDSEPGEGTTVRIYLPLTPEDATGTEKLEPPGSLSGGHETIMVIEDDDQIMTFARQQLADLGYRVIEARDGPEALEALKQRADVVLLFTDMLLPGGMKGHEIAAAARKILPELKVLYTTGYSDTAILEQLHSEGDSHLLWKPYRRAELAHQVRQILDEAVKR
jgi:PAS domain S-box-containing protein